ncbi:MAG: GNAT family N-acetyltransferase [Alphaproteobacteria bacterium]|nr:GNAT family N-acetyltransferase [Alphaproteobacteria bacterium]
MAESPALRTARLDMMPMGRPADLEALVAFHADPQIMATMRDGVLTPTQVENLVAGYAATWRDKGFGMWVLRRRETGGFVGICGLMERADLDAVALRFALRQEEQGAGLASEAVAAALAFAFETRGLDRVVGVARAANVGSRRVMERAGMRFEWAWTRNDAEMTLYAIEKRRWLEQRRAGDQPIGT